MIASLDVSRDELNLPRLPLPPRFQEKKIFFFIFRKNPPPPPPQIFLSPSSPHVHIHVRSRWIQRETSNRPYGGSFRFWLIHRDLDTYITSLPFTLYTYLMRSVKFNNWPTSFFFRYGPTKFRCQIDDAMKMISNPPFSGTDHIPGGKNIRCGTVRCRFPWQTLSVGQPVASWPHDGVGRASAERQMYWVTRTTTRNTPYTNLNEELACDIKFLPVWESDPGSGGCVDTVNSSYSSNEGL